MWDIKPKLVDTDINVVVARGKGGGGWGVGGGLAYGDRWWFDFEW